jgi:hypothetical protein
LVECIPTDLSFGRLHPDAYPTSEEGIQLLRSVYQGVARQAGGVFAAGCQREPEAFAICRGHIEIADEYHKVVQTG